MARVAPINEVLGRFFPGGPIPNRPRKPYGSRKPIQFRDFDAYYEEFYDLISKDIHVSNITNPILNELKADFTQAMKATVKSPSQAKYEDIPEEFASEIDDLPGAVAVSIDLDPVKWIKNPGKQSKSLIGGLIKGTFGYDINKKNFFEAWNFNDVDTKIEKDFIWDPLVKGKRIGQGRLTFGEASKNAFASLLEKQLTGKEPASTPTGTGFTDEDAKELTDYKTNTDSYIIGEGFVSEPSSAVAAAQRTFVDSMMVLGNSGTREDSFTAIGSAFSKVLDSESRNRSGRDVSYIMSAEGDALLKSLVKDVRGNNTKIIDPFGNDFLSITTGTLSGYVAERDDTVSRKIPELKIKEAELLAKPQDKAIEKELKKTRKELGDSEKSLVSLDGKIQAATNQLVASEKDGYGALNTVVKTIQDSGVTDPELKGLANKLNVFANPEIGLTQNITELSRVVFEKNSLVDKDLSKAVADRAALAALPITPDVQKKLSDLDSKIVKLNSTIVALDSRIDTLATTIQGADGAIAKTIEHNTYNPSSDPAVEELVQKLQSVAHSKDALVQNVASIETDVVGIIDSTVSQARETLKEKARLDTGSFVFRTQHELLETVNGFDKVFDDLSEKLAKKNLKTGSKDFDGPKSALVDACKDQIAALDRAEQLLAKDPKALAEFRTLFSAHAKAVEKLRQQAEAVGSTDALDSLLKKYKSVYDSDTIGGGIADVATRRFMEQVYFGDGPLGSTFKSETPSDIFENSKRLFAISRVRYERDKALDVYKLMKEGPSGLINPLMQRFVKEGRLLKIAQAYKFLSKPKQFMMDNVLKPTHFFGLVYDEKMAKKCREAGGWDAWMESKIGEPMSKFWGVNKFTVSFEGFSEVITGGSHLIGAVSLGDLFQGGVSGEVLGAFFKAPNIKELGKLTALHGIKLPVEGVKDVNDFLKNIQELKKWFEDPEKGMEMAKLLGLRFDGQGKLILESLNEKTFNFFKFIAAAKHNTAMTDPTVFLVGRLKLISAALSKIQTGYIAIIANIRKPIVYMKTLLAEGLTNSIMAYLDSVTGMLGEVLRVAVRFIVNVAIDWGEKLITGIMKFDLTEFMEEVTGAISGTMKYLMYFVLAPMILIIVGFNEVSTMMLGISPVDNSRTNGVLLTGCGPIDERAQGVGSCGICDASDSVDWSPYALGKETFTEGIAFVLNAAAKDFNIPAPALGAIFYVEGWSENVDGKFAEDWTKENVCDWSLNEGPLLPECEDRTSSSDARGSFQWIPGWFDPQIEASGVASKTPLPRGEYDPCNFLDAAYASAGRFAELGAAVGAGACGGGWLAPIGSSRPSGYADGLPASAPKVQFAILHYACGANGSECFSENFLDYSRKGLAVFNALKCF